MNRRDAKKPMFIVVILIFIQVVFIISLLSPKTLENVINKELSYMTQGFGTERTRELYSQSQLTTKKLVYDTGLMEKTRSVLLPVDYLNEGKVDDNTHRNLNTNFWTKVDSAIQNLSLNVEFTILRLYSIIPWIPLMLIMVISATLTGFLQRQIKKHGFDYSSPIKHGVSRNAIYWSPVCLYILIMIPIALPIYCMPILFAVVAISVLFYASNTIKRL